MTARVERQQSAVDNGFGGEGRKGMTEEAQP